jgi:hypothetical protein
MQPVLIDVDEIMTQRAMDITFAALREAGLDPRKGMQNPMVGALILDWTKGRMTREKFLHCCRNVLILNPALAKGRGRIGR